MTFRQFAIEVLPSIAGALTGGAMVIFLAGRVFHLYDQRIQAFAAQLEKFEKKFDSKSDDYLTTMADLRIKIAILERAITILRPFRKQMVSLQAEIAALRRKFEAFVEDTYRPEMRATQERLHIVKPVPPPSHD